MNDHSPEFERQFYRAIVPENSPSGTKVIQPVARDKDVGLNSKMRFSLLGEKVERFHIDTETGEITTAMVLDREDFSIYYFTLMAQDSSVTEPRAATVNLTIKISDANDNAPTYSKSAFIVNVPDNIKAGEFIFEATAVDLDEGLNSKISYKISGEDANKFIISNNDGVIKTSAQFSSSDVQTDKHFGLIIHASDHGVEPKSTKCELTIVIRPSHLFPIFSYSSDTLFVLPEDVPVGKTITKISASSPKKGSVSKIKYAIAGGNTRNDIKIDTNSGEVTVGKEGLDYEAHQQYEVWIEASDSDSPILRSVMRIHINVTDTNDNAPVMEKLIYYAEVTEEEPPPQVITQVRATDDDSEENSQISYRLVNDFEGAFEIDSDTGEILTNMRLDREDIANYELIVEAVDQGNFTDFIKIDS